MLTIKYFLNNAVKIRPKTTPPKVTTIKSVRLTSACGLSIQIPGIVKARPPATIAPADIAVCVTLISCKFVFPNSFRRNIETNTTNIIGHGKELNFNAINIELIVRIILPTEPIRRPLIVSCLSVIVLSS